MWVIACCHVATRGDGSTCSWRNSRFPHPPTLTASPAPVVCTAGADVGRSSVSAWRSATVLASSANWTRRSRSSTYRRPAAKCDLSASAACWRSASDARAELTRGQPVLRSTAMRPLGDAGNVSPARRGRTADCRSRAPCPRVRYPAFVLPGRPSRRRRQTRRGPGTDSDVQGGPVDELLDVVVECSALDQLGDAGAVCLWSKRSEPEDGRPGRDSSLLDFCSPAALDAGFRTPTAGRRRTSRCRMSRTYWVQT